MQKYDVFISYSRKDAAIADIITRELDKYQINYFIDREEIRFGENFAGKIVKSIKNCNILLFIWTENSNRSENTIKEIACAVKNKKDIVPFKIGSFEFQEDLDYHLSTKNIIDVNTVNADVIRNLADTLAKQLRAYDTEIYTEPVKQEIKHKQQSIKAGRNTKLSTASEKKQEGSSMRTLSAFLIGIIAAVIGFIIYNSSRQHDAVITPFPALQTSVQRNSSTAVTNNTDVPAVQYTHDDVNLESYDYYIHDNQGYITLGYDKIEQPAEAMCFVTSTDKKSKKERKDALTTYLPAGSTSHTILCNISRDEIEDVEFLPYNDDSSCIEIRKEGSDIHLVNTRFCDIVLSGRYTKDGTTQTFDKYIGARSSLVIQGAAEEFNEQQFLNDCSVYTSSYDTQIIVNYPLYCLAALAIIIFAVIMLVICPADTFRSIKELTYGDARNILDYIIRTVGLILIACGFAGFIMMCVFYVKDTLFLSVPDITGII